MELELCWVDEIFLYLNRNQGLIKKKKAKLNPLGNLNSLRLVNYKIIYMYTTDFENWYNLFSQKIRSLIIFLKDPDQINCREYDIILLFLFFLIFCFPKNFPLVNQPPPDCLFPLMRSYATVYEEEEQCNMLRPVLRRNICTWFLISLCISLSIGIPIYKN